jgi:transposase
VDIVRKVDTMSRAMAETPKHRRPRRQFDDDFKAQAVRLVLDEGKSVGRVAHVISISPRPRCARGSIARVRIARRARLV